MKDSQVYETENLYEASYLLCRGFKLAGKRREGNKFVVLIEGKNVEQESLKYYHNEPSGSKMLFDAYRSLKDFVFQR